MLQPSLSTTAWTDLRLLVSELVTNAVRHTSAAQGAHVRLVLHATGGSVRVEVHDEGAGFVRPEQPEPAEAGTSGWGLWLVAKLATSWGTECAPDACVWFELPLD